MNITIITIGDELLIGQVVDSNSAWMGQELNKLGLWVRRRIAVGDDKGEIIDALDQAKKISDIILITGGLGPTKDDLTKDVLCEYFGGKMIFNEEIFAMVKNIFDRFKRPMIESNVKQAEVPDNCIPIKNFHGTAPGMWFEKEGKIFVSMPGVPYEMKKMMEDFVLPKIKERFKLPVILHKTIHLVGIGESFLAEKIKDIEESFPEGFKLAYLPNLMQVRLRITARGNDEKRMQLQIDDLSKRIQDRVREFIWGYDEDLLEEIIGKILLERKATLSTAESCTGGRIAEMITSVQGASEYFNGSIVSYSNEMKENLLNVKAETLMKFGAVSEEVVKEMVDGALKSMNSTYALAVSGIAGPTGGTEEKPVGTVWIAVGNKERMVTRKFFSPGDRSRNIERSSVSALDMLRRFILDIHS